MIERCTHPQENYIRILFNDIELGERLFQLKFIENELDGLIISSIGDLSKSNAGKLIGILKRIKEQKRVENDLRNKVNS